MQTDPTIDHFVVAGPSLENLREAFVAAGFDPEYGGEHGNGVTHNEVIGFPDRSYVELVSTIEPGRESPWWDAEIHGGSGPAAWALSVEDVDREAARLADAGFAVEGPSRYSRVKPDGTRIEWKLASVGEGLGIPVPFLVEDVTDRDARVPAASDGGSDPAASIAGIADVLIGVESLDEWIDEFRTVFRCGEPNRHPVPDLDARAASFDAPVTLLEPDGVGFLSDRVDAFPNRPIGCLFAASGTGNGAVTDGSDAIRRIETDGEWLPIDLPGRFGVVDG